MRARQCQPHLKPADGFCFRLAVADAKDQVAGAVRGLDARDGGVECVVELQDVTQQKHERDADAAFFAEGLVREGDTCGHTHAHTHARTHPHTTHVRGSVQVQT